MFIKLLPDQVASFWDVIKHAIEESLPPIVGDGTDRMNNILSAALCDKLDVWISFTIEGNVKKINGVMTTRISTDDISGSKSLLMYSLYSYSDSNVDQSYYEEGLKLLAKYANGRGCSRIIAYTDLPYLIDVAKNLGSDTSYTFVTLWRR